MKKTYKEWKAEGYHVQKGQHSTSRNSRGEPLFSHTQVAVTEKRDSNYWQMQYEQEWEGSWEDVLGDPFWYK